MTLRVKVTTRSKELKRVHKRLQKLLDVTNRHVAMKSLAKGVVQQTKKRFKTKRDPDNKRWKPWSPHYAETRSKGDSLLIDMSTHEAGPHLKDSIEFDSRKSDFTIFSDLEYAAAQNFGRPEINLPARTFLGLSEQDVSNIDDWIQSELEKIFF